MIKLQDYFTKQEKMLWGGSVLLILVSFLLFDRTNYVTLFASIIGVTSIIFNAKGNPLGQLLMLFFSVVYGYISFSCAYYGEMVTYMGMTAPMAFFSLITWLRNPYEGNKAEVEVNSISKREVGGMFLLAGVVTVIFYFILTYFHTANIAPSTLSVTTSFIAVYLTFRRSPYFSVAYAANDIVLIILWTLASLENTTYVAVLVCFIAFLANDIYGYISWRKMQEKQQLMKKELAI